MFSGGLVDRDGSIRNCLRERDSPLIAVSARGRATDGLKDVALLVSELWDARERYICWQVKVVLACRKFVCEDSENANSKPVQEVTALYSLEVGRANDGHT
jgi:hypothetical protein